MKITFDINRYNKLLEKEKRLNQENRSLMLENKTQFVELLSYSSNVQYQISYERKQEYYSLICQYIEQFITPSQFQSEFREMQQDDAKKAQMILNDLNQLANFSVDLKAVEFSSLISDIDDISMVAYEFGPEEGISDEKFRKSIEKTFFQIQNFLNKE